VTANVAKGAVAVDASFSTAAWTAFGTLRMPLNTEDSFFPIFKFRGFAAYIVYTASDNTVDLKIYRLADPSTAILSHNVADIDSGTDHRFSVRFATAGSGTFYVASWLAGADTDGITETSDAGNTLTGNILKFIGAPLTGLTPVYDKVVLTNFMLYQVSNISTANYEPYAADLTPTTTDLIYHEKFSEGGDALLFDAATDINSYLVPTPPTTIDSDTEWLHFGGLGVIEIPFYLDFDEYYWTPVTTSARVEWVFQIEVTLPNILAASTIFDYQDILRLDVFLHTDSEYYFKGTFAGTGIVQSARALTAGVRYEVFIGRDADSYDIRVTEVTGTPGTTDTTDTATLDNPAIFNYDKTLGFIIGDKVDQENSAPFGGKIRRFALHNETTKKWHSLNEAVFYYDIDSLLGDEILDRGNRALNAYTGTRVASAPPYYAQGGFAGGSYIAATGGYILANSTPDVDYVGELKKALTKDAVIQRRGNRAFLTSNNVNYMLDDFSKTFRPLGVPRPATKVSCTPQGVGVLDGFVRYAYRWVTRDGTVGPAFHLDPVDARGGVNVFLGADGFGMSGETPFGVSYGESSGTQESRGDTSSDTVETFIAHDTDGNNEHNLLRKDMSFPGLTLEVAVRIPRLDKTKESIFGQGVCCVPGIDRWICDETPYEFPWIGGKGEECTFQFAFRYKVPTTAPQEGARNYQALFGIGARDQHREGAQYRLNHLFVSIQPSSTVDNLTSIVVTRDDSDHPTLDENEALIHFAKDYTFVDGNDYCVVVRRGGSNHADPQGEDLIISIFDRNRHVTNNDGWARWPGTTDVEIIKPRFWTDYPSAGARDHVVWGGCRHEGVVLDTLTSKRTDGPGGDTFAFGAVRAFCGDSTLSNGVVVPGGVMYHGRMWRKDVILPLMATRGLERMAAREHGGLKDRLEVDTAFCPDSSLEKVTGGWDYPQNLRAVYYNYAGKFEAPVVLNVGLDNSPILAYGWNMTANAGTDPDTWTVTDLRKVPLWINWSSRNEGSLSIGVGKKPKVEIAEKRWYDGSGVLTFDEFANVIDLKQWTWITLYYHHIPNPGTAANFDVWLERIFLDGNTGDWGSLFDADTSLSGIAANATPGISVFTRGLFTLGGLPGLDQKYEVEIAEARLWDGEYYTAAGGGGGANAFGPYLSSRIPPNLWDKLWYYLRFMKLDVDDPDNQTTMDQLGVMDSDGDGTGDKQQRTDAVSIYQGAVVKDDFDDPGTAFFIPFPTPPMSSIRGIQIFRSQVVPVVEEFPNGNSNPNGVPDAWRACRSAPLYWLTEIPRGTTSYIDTAGDETLGGKLDAQTGLLPSNPRGVFEWGGYLGVYVQDKPRIFFAESPSSWESFPLHMAYDVPVREYGPIEAAVELASRDARHSRVLCLGKSWGVFIDGSPTAPQANTLGGGVGAASPRCLVVEKGIAYAYNGTLWGISGDGQIADLGLPVLDLLPDPDSARLSISSALNSLFVIDESTGLALRYHLTRQQWFVEDRSALSVTDIDGVDTWVHISGYPSAGLSTVFQDDVESDTPQGPLALITVGSGYYHNGDNTFNIAFGDITGLKVGQRGTLVADSHSTAAANNPHYKQTVTIKGATVIGSSAGMKIEVEEDLSLTETFTDLGGTTHTLEYSFYPGVGYWGTMIDTGQFNLSGDLNYVDVGVERGSGWWAAFDTSDFAKDPADRTGFASAESKPTNIVNASGGAGSARWGLANRQRLERILVYSTKPTDGSGGAVGLTELELNYTSDPGET
jgi:hypothetical protein